MCDICCEIELDELLKAYYACRKHKRNTSSALEFEYNFEQNILDLYHDLRNGTYEIGKSICFVVKKPSTREVWAANFRDRIVHHLIYNRLSPEYNKKFSPDSCACIPKRGTLYGAKRLHSYVRKFTHNFKNDGFYLKCDIANFFVSIDKDVLWNQMEPNIKEIWLKELTKQILYHDCTKNVEYRSSIQQMELVEPRKRLSLCKINKGLPIGNLTSQFFANIFMDVIDKYIKKILKVKFFIRYVDDIILLHESVSYLKKLELLINKKMISIHTKLNPKKTIIQSISRGITFVGHTIYNRCRFIKQKIKRNIKFIIKYKLYKNLQSYIGYTTQFTSEYNFKLTLQGEYT